MRRHDADARRHPDRRSRHRRRQCRPGRRQLRPADRRLHPGQGEGPGGRSSRRPSTSTRARPATARRRPSTRPTCSTRRRSARPTCPTSTRCRHPLFVGTAQESHLLVLSQESGKIVEIDRDGTFYSSLDLVGAADDQRHVLRHDGRGHHHGPRRPHLPRQREGRRRHRPSAALGLCAADGPNQAPTGDLADQPGQHRSSRTPTPRRGSRSRTSPITDDGHRHQQPQRERRRRRLLRGRQPPGSTSRPARCSTIETKTSYSVTVNVDDPTVGTTPDASTPFTLTSPTSSTKGRRAVADHLRSGALGERQQPARRRLVRADQHRHDRDRHHRLEDGRQLATRSPRAVALNGVTSIAPGESVIFIEGDRARQVTLHDRLVRRPMRRPGCTIGNYSGLGRRASAPAATPSTSSTPAARSRPA